MRILETTLKPYITADNIYPSKCKKCPSIVPTREVQIYLPKNHCILPFHWYHVGTVDQRAECNDAYKADRIAKGEEGHILDFAMQLREPIGDILAGMDHYKRLKLCASSRRSLFQIVELYTKNLREYVEQDKTKGQEDIPKNE